MAKKNVTLPTLKAELVLEAEKSNMIPSSPGMDAREDGLCAITRDTGILLFAPSASGWSQTFVETGLRSSEVALHPTEERFVVWTSPTATLARERSVVLFTRVAGRYERSVVWRGSDPLFGKLGQTSPMPVWAGFVEDRLVVQMVSGQWVPTLDVYALEAASASLTETVDLGRQGGGGGWMLTSPRGCALWWGSAVRLVTFAPSTAVSTVSLPIPGASAWQVSAAMNDSLLVVGAPREQGTHVRSGVVFAYQLVEGSLQPGPSFASVRPRRYEGFGGAVSLQGDRVAITSIGLERAPSSHNEGVAPHAQTTIFTLGGEPIARLEPWKPVRDHERRFRFRLARLTRDFLLEFHDDADELHVFRCP